MDLLPRRTGFKQHLENLRCNAQRIAPQQYGPFVWLASEHNSASNSLVLLSMSQNDFKTGETIQPQAASGLVSRSRGM